jgi:hypothetical protein
VFVEDTVYTSSDIGGACSTNPREESFVQGFGVET